MSVIETLQDRAAPGFDLAGALRLLLSDSFVYLLGAALLGLGNFILVPLYTRVLPPDGFGVYALLDISILILVQLTQLKLDVAYLKTFAEVEPASRERLLGSVVMLGAVAAVLGGAPFTLFVASSYGQRWFQSSGSVAFLLLPIIVLETVQGMFLGDLRARRRAVAYCASTLVRLLTLVGASVWFLSVRHTGLHGLFMGRLVGDVAGVLLLVVLCSSHICARFDWALLRPMIHFGLPLVWSGLMVVLMDATGRFLLSKYQGLDQVGYLGAAIKIGSIFQLMVSQPFGMAWGGLMFQIAKWPHARTVYSKVFTYALVFSSVTAFCMALFTAPLFRIFATKAYAPAMSLFPLILLVRAISVLEYPAAISIYLSGRTRWFAWIYSLGFGVNLAANALLDRQYGALGTIWAWLLAWLAIIAGMRLVGERSYGLDYSWGLTLVAFLPWTFFLLGPGARVTDLLQNNLAYPFVLSAAILLVLGSLVIRDWRFAQERSL